MQYVKFSRIIEYRTCSESGLLFQRKLIMVGGSVGKWQWIGG